MDDVLYEAVRSAQGRLPEVGVRALRDGLVAVRDHGSVLDLYVAAESAKPVGGAHHSISSFSRSRLVCLSTPSKHSAQNLRVDECGFLGCGTS